MIVGMWYVQLALVLAIMNLYNVVIVSVHSFFTFFLNGIDKSDGMVVFGVCACMFCFMFV